MIESFLLGGLVGLTTWIAFSKRFSADIRFVNGYIAIISILLSIALFIS